LEIIAYPNPATETVWISGISGLIHVQAVSLSDIVLDEKEYESQGSPIEFPIRDSFGQQFIVKDARGVSQLLLNQIKNNSPNLALESLSQPSDLTKLLKLIIQYPYHGCISVLSSSILTHLNDRLALITKVRCSKVKDILSIFYCPSLS
jgi:hypothetical protein